jgi:hypothetical protein
MTYTSHGHHILGTFRTEPPTSRARCGGPGLCSKCSREAAQHTDVYGPTAGFEPEILPGDNDANYQAKAMAIVKKFVDEAYGIEEPGELPAYETYIVWFAKVLKNWKALVSTTMEDDMYYEVTYNGEKHEAYLDAYTKRINRVIPD